MERINNENQQFVEESYPVAHGYPIYTQNPSTQAYPVPNTAYYPQYGYPNPNINQNANGSSNGMINAYLPQFRENVNRNVISTQQKQITLRVPNCLSNLYDKIMERKGPKDSISAQCPNCHQEGNTQVKSKLGGGALACTGLLCCCCPGLFWCPLIVDDCYDHQHECPSCGSVVMKEKFLL